MDKLDFKIMQSDDVSLVPAMLESASVSHKQEAKSIEWFKWKYWGSPMGPSVVAYAEAQGGCVAGVVAFGLYELTRGRENIKAGLSYETFVHPDFRGAGLFSALIKSAVDECRRRGLRMLFNFPNPMSLPGFRKQGWIPVNCLRSYLKPASLLSCIAKVDSHFGSAAFKPDHISEFNPRDYEGFDECLVNVLSIRSETAWSAVRTPEYMVWRYHTYPLNRYVIVRTRAGWAVVRTGRRGKYSEAQIMEMFPQSDYGFRFMAVLCSTISKRLHPDLITISLSRAHPVAPSLWQSAFLPVRNNANFTYYPVDDALKTETREWVITATEYHTY